MTDLTADGSGIYDKYRATACSVYNISIEQPTDPVFLQLNHEQVFGEADKILKELTELK